MIYLNLYHFFSQSFKHSGRTVLFVFFIYLNSQFLYYQKPFGIAYQKTLKTTPGESNNLFCRWNKISCITNDLSTTVCTNAQSSSRNDFKQKKIVKITIHLFVYSKYRKQEILPSSLKIYKRYNHIINGNICAPNTEHRKKNRFYGLSPQTCPDSCNMLGRHILLRKSEHYSVSCTESCRSVIHTVIFHVHFMPLSAGIWYFCFLCNNSFRQFSVTYFTEKCFMYF